MRLVRSVIAALAPACALALAAAPGTLLAAPGAGSDGDHGPRHSGSTWSVVAVDAATGDVGVAAATCLSYDNSALAVLVPGQGAASVQANFDRDNRDAVLGRLQMGDRANDILAELTHPEYDDRHYWRQYGVVSRHDEEVVTDGFSGVGISKWAGRVDSAEHGVTVQGNFLESEAVVEEALRAFIAAEGHGVLLADRLLRALEAGSAAGGDRRCNEGGVRQTCMSAFIAVARADQPPFVVRDLASTETDHPELPWLFLTVTESSRGPNPIVELRCLYDEWRAAQLPPCDMCSRLAIDVPPGRMEATRWDGVTPIDESPPGERVSGAADAAAREATAPVLIALACALAVALLAGVAAAVRE